MATRDREPKTYPLCAHCHAEIRGRCEYMYSLIDRRNYGPFHADCAWKMDEADDLAVRRVQFPERYAQMPLEVFQTTYWRMGW